MSVHVPLLMRAPWLPASAGRHTQSTVELLDLYRSIAALAGLPAPPADVGGDDFSPLFENPDVVLKSEAYAQYSRCPGEREFPKVFDLPDWALNNCEDVPVVNITCACGPTGRGGGKSPAIAPPCVTSPPPHTHTHFRRHGLHNAHARLAVH